MVKKQNSAISIKIVLLYTQKQVIHKDIAEDVETRIDTLNYGKSKRVIG